MVFQKSWVLSDHVHDAGRDDGFVVFASFLFAESEEVFDDVDEEFPFVVFLHGAGDGSDGPAEFLESVPVPFGLGAGVDLALEFVE